MSTIMLQTFHAQVFNSREIKTHVHTKACACMFIAVLLLRTKQTYTTWKEPKRPSTGKCVNHLWYIHPRDYSLTRKGNNINS